MQSEIITMSHGFHLKIMEMIKYYEASR